eukprot:gene1114-2656_t
MHTRVAKSETLLGLAILQGTHPGVHAVCGDVPPESDNCLPVTTRTTGKHTSTLPLYTRDRAHAHSFDLDFPAVRQPRERGLLPTANGNANGNANVWHSMLAAEMITDNSTVVTAMAAAEPQTFYSRAAEVMRKRSGVTLFCANPSREYQVFSDGSLLHHAEIRTMFLTSHVRQHSTHRPGGTAHVHYVPQHLSQIDLFWGSCSPPRNRGFVSIGPSNCYESEIMRRSKRVVLEVNPEMPFTLGDTIVPTSRVDAFVACDSDMALPTYPRTDPDSTDEAIAVLTSLLRELGKAHVADLIPDGATIQLGIGAIPNALAFALQGKKDLGVHTEMINDAILQLFQANCITGSHKTLWPEKIVGAFAYGSPDLYALCPVNIGQNHLMHSINSAVEVDLTGQVCSESIGHVELSGAGGAADTHVGAQRAFSPATSLPGSKIVAELRPGAKVTVSRNDVDTIVTEFGVASLKGQTAAERAR